MTLKILQKQNFQVCPHLVIAGSKNNLKHIFMVAEGNVFFEVPGCYGLPYGTTWNVLLLLYEVPRSMQRLLYLSGTTVN